MSFPPDPPEGHEPRVWAFPICELCLRTSGPECHTPGCSFWMHDAPKHSPVPLDSPIVQAVMEGQEWWPGDLCPEP